jgi:pimeloyl-ACP methyl ester carboxylesterase
MADDGGLDLAQWAAWAAGIALAVYVGACALLFAFQRSLLYYPQPSAWGRPETTFTLPVDGAELHVSVRPHEGPKALVYFGGNAEDVSRSLPSLADTFPGHALYLLHYRGYGGSTGEPSEAALHADALALFDKVALVHPDVTVVGRSLGSGVAIRLASERPVSRLVLVTPYDSIEALAAQRFPWLPMRWLLRDTYRSIRHAPSIRVPTLLIAAGNDKVIPLESTERLLAAFPPGVASLVVVHGAGHDSLSSKEAYLEALQGFQQR